MKRVIASVVSTIATFVMIFLALQARSQYERAFTESPRAQPTALALAPNIDTRINLPLVGNNFNLPRALPILLTGYDVLLAQTLQNGVPISGQTVSFEQCKRVEEPCTEWYPAFSVVTGPMEFGPGIAGSVGKSGILVRVTACAQSQIIMTIPNQFRVITFQC